MRFGGGLFSSAHHFHPPARSDSVTKWQAKLRFHRRVLGHRAVFCRPGSGWGCAGWWQQLLPPAPPTGAGLCGHSLLHWARETCPAAEPAALPPQAVPYFCVWVLWTRLQSLAVLWEETRRALKFPWLLLLKNIVLGLEVKEGSMSCCSCECRSWTFPWLSPVTLQRRAALVQPL